MMRWVISAVLWASACAWGHPLDLGLVNAKVTGTALEVEFRVHPDVAAALKDPPPVLLGELDTPAGACAWGPASTRREPLAVVVSARARCPSAERLTASWRLPLLRSAAVLPSYRILVRLDDRGVERVYSAGYGEPGVTLDLSRALGFGHFVWMGVEHIGMAPSEWHDEGGWKLPDGIDHILFILALILGGGSLTALLATATGFTLGHSVTLALAALGVVQLPGRIVESAIALSIAFVAVETLLRKDPRHRWKIATAFGLVHGFGFANALTELPLSGAMLVKALFGYNLGVEIGQVLLVCLIAPPLAYLSRVPWWRAVTIPTASTGIFLSGGYWFLQRALGL